MYERLFKESDSLMLRRRRREAWQFWTPIVAWGAVAAFAIGYWAN